MANDAFVEIARTGAGGRKELLHEPKPIPHDTRKCILTEPDGKSIETVKKMNTKEELEDELTRMREIYKPYLKNMAPEMAPMNTVIPIKEFLLDGKEKITLPHYGGPVGYAKQVYETEFSLPDIIGDKCVYICVGGADYETAIMVNGEFAGTHEGFFDPFEFDITELVKEGTNKLKIVLKNDCVYNGTGFGDNKQGDKLYAATGIGWDDPEVGWHHCPPGMGLYDDVYIEIRNKTHIHDLFVRPVLSENRAEAWIEVESCEYTSKDLSFAISVYGQNFEEAVFENAVFETKELYKYPAQKGTNLYKVSFGMENCRLWHPDTPHLYQMQVKLIYNGKTTDTGKVTFGMREMRQDTDSEPKGMLYLNGKKIRLRGANTMGYEQLDVMRGDFDRLIDDMLLAKICNMNFLRITQRPVQSEVYDYCDMLGVMVQTDLPLFGSMRRNKVAEAIRQAEEMERLIRSHPSCIMVTYINEPKPDITTEPHRHLERNELEEFFSACNVIVRLNNPDRIIKHVDGDFNPPTEGMPDFHCYTCWYNGHGVDIGKLIKGYNVEVKPGWYYGCGEYGAEGLEDLGIMKKYYPPEWLKEPFDPANIVRCQTKNIHYHFFDTQDNLQDWITVSQDYQAWATKVMTDAYRRDSRLISNAIHLFIDAWPSGWMKTIMDCERNPKKAYFEYRNSLEPVKVSLRTDRFTYTAGEEINMEAHLCNDTNAEGKYTLRFELYKGDVLVKTGSTDAYMIDCDVNYIADASFTAPDVSDRETFTLKAILTDENGSVITYEKMDIEVFADVDIEPSSKLELICNLSEGEHSIAGETVTVKNCSMSPMHFVSRKTGHKIVEEFRPKDFSYWYNKGEDMITPIAYSTFTAEGFTPVLTSGNCGADTTTETGNWHTQNAVAVKVHEGKLYAVSTVELRTENPVVKRFVKNLNDYAERI